VGENGRYFYGSGNLSQEMFQSSNNIYVGEHRRNTDEKGRVLLPAKWRFESDQNEIYIAIPSPSGCIIVYPPKMVEKLREKASNVSLGDKKGQKTLTKLFSRADQLTCDGQGRILLNQMLYAHGGLNREILMVGNFITFSIWDPARYEKYLSKDEEEDDEISVILTQLGL
jgi:MraZ protein